MNKRAHRGNGLRPFLNEQGIVGEVETRALKQAVSLQLGRLPKGKEITKVEMASLMKTSHCRPAGVYLSSRATRPSRSSTRRVVSAWMRHSAPRRSSGREYRPGMRI
jgi:ribosomal protein L2